MVVSLMKAINSIGSAVDKLPNEEKFNAIKTELNIEVSKTLKPFQENMEKFKEVLDRGGKGGMYG